MKTEWGAVNGRQNELSEHSLLKTALTQCQHTFFPTLSFFQHLSIFLPFVTSSFSATSSQSLVLCICCLLAFPSITTLYTHLCLHLSTALSTLPPVSSAFLILWFSISLWLNTRGCMYPGTCLWYPWALGTTWRNNCACKPSINEMPCTLILHPHLFFTPLSMPLRIPISCPYCMFFSSSSGLCEVRYCFDGFE